MVERLQEAARESARYFEQVPRDLEPLQFAFNLITRSGRIGHSNLTMRDPRLTRELDGWFGGAPLAPPPLFTPLTLAGLELPNRVVAEARDGIAAAVRTGAALVLTRPIAVTPEGRISPDAPTLDDDWDLDGACVCAVLTHAGARGAVHPPAVGIDVPLTHGAWPLVSASPIPYGPRMQTPAELDEAGMERIREAFAAAAARAAEAGFAALELDMADGRLLGSFLSPLSNHRSDDYGADRLRFPLAVLRAVRETWSGPLIARIGRHDAVAIAAAARDAGADAVHVVSGHARAESAPEYRAGHLTDLADLVRAGAGVPTVVGGYLTTLDEVNTIVRGRPGRPVRGRARGAGNRRRHAGMTPQHVDLDVADGVATVTLKRPERLNALTFESYADLRDLVPALPLRGDVRAAVLTGQGRGFCAGGDVEEIIGELPHEDRAAARVHPDDRRGRARAARVPAADHRRGQRGRRRRRSGDRPGRDFRLLARSACFAFLFTQVGLTGADMGSAYLLPRLIGLGRATELLMLGERVEAERAVEIGLRTASSTTWTRRRPRSPAASPTAPRSPTRHEGRCSRANRTWTSRARSRWRRSRSRC